MRNREGTSRRRGQATAHLVGLRARGPDDLSVDDLVAAYRVGGTGRAMIRSAMDEMMSSLRDTGTASLDGQAYAARMRRHPTGVGFYLDRGELDRLGARLLMRVGGFEPPGEYLIARMVADRINATTQADWFAGPWAGVERTARSGGEVHEVDGVRLRVRMVMSGTRTAVGMHRDDVAGFARVAGITLGGFDAWEDGWLNERDVAALLGTHADNPDFGAAWDGMKRLTEKDGAVVDGVPLRAAWLRRGGVVTVYLHETSVERFDRATGIRAATRVPPPRTDDWIPSTEFARAMGTSPANVAYQALLASCADDVQAGRAPTIDGHPVMFERRSNRVARPWCFHRSEMGRVMGALGISDAPPKGPDDMSRLELYSELGTSSAGTQTIVAVWEACTVAWGRGDTADLSGHHIRGGLRKSGKSLPYWCVNRSDVTAFRMALAAMGGRGVRDAGIVRRKDGFVPLDEITGLDGSEVYLDLVREEMEATFDPVSRTASVGGETVTCGFVSGRALAVRPDSLHALGERVEAMRASPAITEDDDGYVSEDDLSSMFGP